MKYQFHPVADVFPLMNDEELIELADDMFLYGQREPILLFDNQIIDGRNRYLACEQKEITPKYKEFEGSEKDLTAFVISMNLRRRQLDESQRSMIAARLATMRSGERTDLPQICGRLSQDDAAKMLNVSPRSVSAAARVEKHGCFEIVEQVEEGRLKVSAAEKMVVDEGGKPISRTKQLRLLQRGREAKRKVTAEERIKKILKSCENTGVACLACNPEIKITDESLMAHLKLLTERAPKYARFFMDIFEELDAIEISDDYLSAKEKIIAALDLPNRDFQQIQSATQIPKKPLEHYLSVMIEYEVVTVIEQGGKTEAARGQRRKLYSRAKGGTGYLLNKLSVVNFELMDAESATVH